MKNAIKQVIFDQKRRVQDSSTVVRYIDDALVECSEILVISGIRRCGKSTLLQQIRQKQTEQDYYLNFDDDRLISFTVDDFQSLYEIFIELFGLQKTFYFDEIQNVKGWERFVRRLYDAGNKVFVTGSNATMLSRELGTHLTGRYCKFELYPFSFVEYLTFNAITFDKTSVYTTTGRAQLSQQFQLYLQTGGFPLYIQSKNDFIIKSLFESIVYKDVLVRNSITNEREMLELLYYLASNFAKLSSNNSLTKVIGVKNATTVKHYIDCVQNTYLLFQVSKFDYSLKKQIQNLKKTYFIDNAIVNKIGFHFSENSGRLLENAVFIELKRRECDIFYHHQKTECDFVVRTGTTITEAIQVCAQFENDDTKKRELRGLLDAMEIYNLSKGIIITLDTEEELKHNGKTITFIPAWKWMLEK